MARSAFEALVRVLVHAGQWILVPSGSVFLWLGVLEGFVDVDAWESGAEKLIVTRIFSDRGCVEDGEEPGQRGRVWWWGWVCGWR